MSEVSAAVNKFEMQIDSLLLIGCLRCSGSFESKAEVFMRIVCPEGKDRIIVTDNDITTSIYFLTSMATILHRMQSDWVMQPKADPNYQMYSQLMEEYEDVFQEVLEQFRLDVFGEYSNSVSESEFIQALKAHGWKYFDKKNLNELFKVKLEELWKEHRLLNLKQRLHRKENSSVGLFTIGAAKSVGTNISARFASNRSGGKSNRFAKEGKSVEVANLETDDLGQN